MTPTLITLPNGLRAVHLHMPKAPVSYAGLAVHAGSRHEDVAAGEAGLAHFVEHCIFKGTQQHSAEYIRNAMECVGGELNAFTGKDDTVIYTVSPAGNEHTALSLIADITAFSTFPTPELRREKRVVAAEIDSYRDSPADQIFDDFEDMVLRGTALGHNILGSRSTLRHFSSADCQRWLGSRFVGRRSVLFYAGAMSEDDFRQLSTQYFDILPEGSEAEADTAVTPKSVCSTRRRDTCQTHCIIGTAIPALKVRTRLALSLLCNILGGPGMNSLLNVELRERRGLVYTVEASVSHYLGASVATVYYGCEPSDDAECRRLVTDMLRKCAEQPFDADFVNAAKRQYIGQTLIADENTAERIIAQARSVLLYGSAMTRDEFTAMLNSLSAEDLAGAAALLANPSRLTFTPR